MHICQTSIDYVFVGLFLGLILFCWSMCLFCCQYYNELYQWLMKLYNKSWNQVMYILLLCSYSELFWLFQFFFISILIVEPACQCVQKILLNFQLGLCWIIDWIGENWHLNNFESSDSHTLTENCIWMVHISLVSFSFCTMQSKNHVRYNYKKFHICYRRI